MFWIIVAVVAFLLIWLYVKFFKLLKVKNVFFVDGAPGTGKTFLCVHLAIRLYRKSHRRYVRRKFFLCVLSKLPFKCFKESLEGLEEPFLYSNMLIRGVPMVLLTRSLLMRQDFRFAYGSVILFDEMSLLVDQFDFKDRVLSDKLKVFFKLIRHETKGGYLVSNSQTINDLHYSMKSVLSDYIYIHHVSQWLPFFSILKVQEMAYSADSGTGTSVVNVRDGDIEDVCKMVLVPKRYFKKYDTYYLSAMTDHLAVYKEVVYLDRDASLKMDEVVTFKEHAFYKGEITIKEIKKDDSPKVDA